MADFYDQVVASAVQGIQPAPVVNKANAVPKTSVPRYLVPMEARNFIDTYANHLVRDGHDVREQVNAALGWNPAVPGAQPAIRVPNPDPCLALASEGDVVRASQLSLVAPVESIVHRIYDVRPGSATGVTAFWSVSEETIDKNRTDLAWYVTRNGATRCALVLEYKKYGLLHFDDWLLCLGQEIEAQNWDAESLNQEAKVNHIP